MANLSRRLRFMQGKPVFDPRHPMAAVQVAVQMHKQRKKFLDDLKDIPLHEIRRLLKTWEELPDAHGRLHNERSGEADRANGMSEIEALASAQQEAENDGGIVSPAGCDPQAYTRGETPKKFAFYDNDDEQRKQHLFERKIQLVSDRMMKSGACSICGSTDEDHIWKKWYESNAAHVKFLTMHSVGAPSVVTIMLHERVDYDHLNAIDKMLREHWVVRTAKAELMPAHGDPITLWSDKWLADGWRGCFFSLRSNRTEVVLPSQAVARAFFGQS